MKLEIEMMIRVVSSANLREHYMAKGRRIKSERKAAHAYVHNLLVLNRKKLVPPLTITLTRRGLNKLDRDNLAGGFKGLQDGIADALKIDDGSELLNWIYQQEAGHNKYSVLAVIEDSTP